MNFGNTREALAERSILHEEDVLVSERTFNIILGGTLLWGFLLNWLMVHFMGASVVRFAIQNGTGMIFIGYFVLVLLGAGMMSAGKPVLSFIGYNLIAVPIGVILCIALYNYPMYVVKNAVLYTGVITAAFMAAAMFFPDFFLSMGRVLLTGIGMLIFGEFIIGIFTGNWASLDYFAAALFGMFIGFDWARCAVCQPTANNAVVSAANLYLDIINLFLRLLRIMNRNRD